MKGLLPGADERATNRFLKEWQELEMAPRVWTKEPGWRGWTDDDSRRRRPEKGGGGGIITRGRFFACRVRTL